MLRLESPRPSGKFQGTERPKGPCPREGKRGTEKKQTPFTRTGSRVQRQRVSDKIGQQGAFKKGEPTLVVMVPGSDKKNGEDRPRARWKRGEG